MISGSKVDSKVAGFLVFSNVRIIGHFKLCAVIQCVKDCPAGLENWHNRVRNTRKEEKNCHFGFFP